MKRIDKAKELHPDMREIDITYRHCPEQLIDCKPASCPTTKDGKACYTCWNMEVEE